ncbi:helix-turn-helix domain-containing protein [Pelagibacterium lacus]|uniref:Chromosomal replication initiator DnaA C-terminal domain-containing protein n=1 Tax=Pelagibacterium lacus TaxID=2282655 RepID=A0A369WAS8_9HYPH|nr:helix-turn-helix domain-containing protein [Pelagibacterium lacus]RDE10500.1 hypothetical protein DVH29_00675 [Pelagibacterium lacus]
MVILHSAERHAKHSISARQGRTCRAIVRAVAGMTGTRHDDFFARSRCPMPTAHARQTAMYLCHVLTGLTMTQVGRYFGRDRTTVAHACAVVEDLRDDPVFDAALDAIERRVTARRCASPATSTTGAAGEARHHGQC